MESICDADQNCLRNHGLIIYGSRVTGGKRGKWVILAQPGPENNFFQNPTINTFLERKFDADQLFVWAESSKMYRFLVMGQKRSKMDPLGPLWGISPNPDFKGP